MQRSMNAPGSPSSALQTMYFALGVLVVPRLPFDAGGEARAAAAAEAGGLDLVDHLLRGELGERLAGGHVAVARDVGVDVVIVHGAAVAQRDLDLFLEEVDVVDLGHAGLQSVVIEGVLRQHLAAYQMRL